MPPTITFLTIRPPCFVFVKTHLTFSPAATTNVAVLVPVLPVEFESSQTIDVSAQPA